MLFLDTSALVKRYVAEPGSALVARRMEGDPEWVVSAVASTEARITLCRLGFDEGDGTGVWARLREDLKRCLIVPLDQACLDRAADIGCRFGIRTLDALHLAAAERLPRPLAMITFDRRQARAARSMDLPVEGV
ncbi:MAG TPA: type II toxin-antitoxin system VapC family toxin [Candidatus Limnocylindrales bacterium]|jgi:predicted nucleic acid-binding protein|nr:type II toxin-antitoxin system VapC family toxin [Candidatus Limnocylindrales bacterium]